MNQQVYGLKESLVRAGYPMLTDVNEEFFLDSIANIDEDTFLTKLEDNGKFKRAVKLGNAPGGSGHDKFLRLITVQFDMIAPRYFWQEWSTYNFNIDGGSQSTMHCITKFDVNEMCNEYTDSETIDRLKQYIEDYKTNPTTDNLLRVKSNIPEGLELGRAISSNYAQLKTIYNQRHNHRLPEWSQVFCPWCLTLPYFKELCIKNVEGECK
jgi:hypothetical protein